VTRDAWLRQLDERPDRPQGRQRRQFDVLVALAGQLDAETGEGSVSMAELVKVSDVSERTARRAIGWAVTAGLLRRTARGHRLGDGTAAWSCWTLLGEQAQQVISPPQPANSKSQPVNSPRTAGTRTKKATKAEIADFRQWAGRQDQPPCPHGQPGGDLVGPDGIAMCPACRRQTRTDPDTLAWSTA
jgi:hypothetical protein